MISQILGVIVLAAIIGIFLSAVTSFRQGNATSLFQESSRNAMDILDKAIQQSGYSGCSSSVSNASPIDSSDPGISRQLSNWAYENYALKGYSADDSDGIKETFGSQWIRKRYQSGTTPVGDILLVRTTVGTELELALHDPENQTMVFRGNAKAALAPGQILQINDCNHSATFQIDQHKSPDYISSGNVSKVYYGADQTVNCKGFGRTEGGGLTEAGLVLLGGDDNASCRRDSQREGFDHYRFAAGSRAHAISSAAYYIGFDTNTNEPTLFRIGIGSNGIRSYSEAIVEGVENIRFLYGVDDDHNKTPDRYLSASVLNQDPALWHQVASVRSWMTIRSIPNRGKKEFHGSIKFPDIEGKMVHCDGINSFLVAGYIQACGELFPETDSTPVRNRKVIHKEFFIRNYRI